MAPRLAVDLKLDGFASWPAALDRQLRTFHPSPSAQGLACEDTHTSFLPKRRRKGARKEVKPQDIIRQIQAEANKEKEEATEIAKAAKAKEGQDEKAKNIEAMSAADREQFRAQMDYLRTMSKRCLHPKPLPSNQLAGGILDTRLKLPLCSRFIHHPCDLKVVDGEMLYKQKPSPEEMLKWQLSQAEKAKAYPLLKTAGFAGSRWAPNTSFTSDLVSRMEEEEADNVATWHPQDYGVIGSVSELMIVLGPPRPLPACGKWYFMDRRNECVGPEREERSQLRDAPTVAAFL